MEVINKHIAQYLKNETSQSDDWHFNSIYEEIEHSEKENYYSLLKYFHSLINISKTKSLEQPSVIHIHFQYDFDDFFSNLCLIFILTQFYNDIYIRDEKLQNNNEVEKKLNELRNRKLALRACPAGASKKNKISQKWEADKKTNNKLIKFYDKYKYAALSPKTIINIPVKILNNISNYVNEKPIAVVINQSNELKSYNILNTEKSLNELDDYGNLIDNLESLVIFDCERKRIMENYSFPELCKWNSEFGTDFKNLIIVTFGKKYSSLNGIRDKIESIREKFKIPDYTNYTILSTEIDLLLKRKLKSPTSIEFVGLESSFFWDTFVLETSIRELYELRSIKLMNIYSVCYSDEIKGYIIDELFSQKESSELISSSTKMAILELRDEDIAILKGALSTALDLIIKSEIKESIIENLINRPIIIFEEAIIRNAKLLSKITNCLGLTRSIKLKTWSDLLNLDSNYFLILSYRNQGKYPNYYYPNLLEFEFNPETTANALLPNFLFGYQYQWSKYYLNKDYYICLAHPFRVTHFEWNKLKNTIQNLKPEKKLDIDWNLENEYSNSEQRATFKIKLKNQRAKTFNSSDLFIASDEKNISRRVVKIDFLMTIEKDDSKAYIQNLDEIQENINIYEKIVDKKKQEEELEVIRKQFNLGDETAGRLWKVLLKKIGEEIGEENLYNELKFIFERKGLKIVSQFHFKNSWINPQSESIAPLSKKVFIELCEYLKIPKIYFIIIQRIRNASKQSSRQSTRQMNHLLKDLFNDGCFDNGKNAREIINNRLAFYKSNHPLDELGIDENHLADNLVTLTELIQPELKLLELETIEKLSNE
jgi:hypothetical protein